MAEYNELFLISPIVLNKNILGIISEVERMPVVA